MIFKTGLTAVAALALAASPALAASGAQSLSIAPATEQLGDSGESSLGGGGGFAAIALGGAILAGFVLAILDANEDDDGNDGAPASP